MDITHVHLTNSKLLQQRHQAIFTQKPEYSVDTPPPAMAVHQGSPSTSRRKRAAPAADEGLVLQVTPEAVQVKKPHLARYSIIQVDSDNCVWATVNGRPCIVCLDSGSTMPVLFMPLARALGLVRGGEATETMGFDMWTGNVTVEVVTLREVVVVLAGGVEVHTPAVVFPEAEGDCNDMFVLDVKTMRRGHMIQAFRPGGSSLAIHRPDLLRRAVPLQEHDARAFTFRVQQEGSAAPLVVLLDTGSKNFAISQEWARRNSPGGDGGDVRHVALRLAPGCCLHAEWPGRLDSSSQAFVLGLTPLQRHHAVLDYRRQALSFRCGARRLQVQLAYEE